MSTNPPKLPTLPSKSHFANDLCCSSWASFEILAVEKNTTRSKKFLSVFSWLNSATRDNLISAIIPGIQSDLDFSDGGKIVHWRALIPPRLDVQATKAEFFKTIQSGFNQSANARSLGPPHFSARQLRLLRLIAKIADEERSLFHEIKLLSELEPSSSAALSNPSIVTASVPETQFLRIRKVETFERLGHEVIFIRSDDRPARELELALDADALTAIRAAKSAGHVVEFQIFPRLRRLTSEPARSFAKFVSVRRLDLFNWGKLEDFGVTAQNDPAFANRKSRGGRKPRKS